MKSKNMKRMISIFLTFTFLAFNFLSVVNVKPAMAAGAGTLENPYSVAEAILSVNQDGKQHYAVGFIVGQPSSAGKVNFGESVFSDTAVAIADSLDEKDPQKMLYVQFDSKNSTSKALRSTFGLLTKPEVKGKCVIFGGTLTSYFDTHPGMRTAIFGKLVDTEIVKATSVSLDNKTLSLVEGKSSDLVATISPANTTDKTMSWASSDTSIATVNNGLVTAVKAGITIITVKTTDGNFTDTCTVTVSQPAKPESITLDKSKLLVKAGTTSNLVATVLPIEAENKTITWTSSDNSIATVTDGVVSGVAEGKATITATTVVGGKSASCEVVVYQGEDTTAPVITNLTPLNGASTGTNLIPEISAEYTDFSGIDTSSVKLTVDGVDMTSKANITDTKLTYVPSENMTIGSHSVTLEVSDVAAAHNKATQTWVFTVGEDVYNWYFGQLHAHTNYSDGQGTPDDAYTWARDKGEADFFALTDHSNSFDSDVTKDSKGNVTATNENITDVSQSSSTEWKKVREISNKYNKDNEFVAIGGFEMTWSGSTGGWGHINTFNTEWFASRNNQNMDLKSYYSRIGKDTTSVSQLNHPGKTFGDFNDFGYWTPEVDKVVNLIEVGNGEGAVRGAGYFPSYEYYTRALDKGWHVAPTNNQDNHKQGWVTANDARTVVLATKLTRDEVYKALQAKRVYATEDKNLKINYTLNGKPMGSYLSNPDKINIKVNVQDMDASETIGKISVIVDGGIELKSYTSVKNTDEISWTMDPQYSYYYIKVVQPDKDIAVTAPVWTKVIQSAGLSSVTVGQDPQIVNTPTDVTAVVQNNTSDQISNTKVEFFENSMTDADKLGEVTIDNITAAGSATAKITYIPKNTGNINIYAKATILLNGVEKTSTQMISYLVAQKDDLVKVVIDAGHVNQYVSGDYPGKMTVLTQTLKEKKYMLVQNNDVLTDEDLANTKVLILTDPQSRDTSKLARSNYTDAEIATIKNYVDRGGALIIASRADYDDAITGKDANGKTIITGQVESAYQSSAQGNRVLDTIGSNLRFNDDEMIDKTTNGGQTFRLYFDDFLSTKYHLTDNMTPGYTYSAYSGCSVVLKSGGNDEKVDWLVGGHSTTETLDSDTNNDAVPVQIGTVKAIAAEVLPNGGKVIVAGTTFFSDFETQTGDNAYCNKEFTEKVFNWMTAPNPAPVKTVAEVRVDSDKNGIPDLLGKRFAVEGTVTAMSVGTGVNNAFFDVIYVQDTTGGLTVFGVSAKAIPLGTKVRITGLVGQYEGDSQLAIKNETTDVEILDPAPVVVAPKPMGTNETMLEENEGWLVQTTGIVKRIVTTNGDNSLYINDGSGEAKAYVNGYIGDGTGNKDVVGKWDPTIQVGDKVSVIGLASQDAAGHRIRVRNTAEIVKLATPPAPTAPVITIQGVENGQYLTSSFVPQISVNKGTWQAMLNGEAYNGEEITNEGYNTLVVVATSGEGYNSTKRVKFVLDIPDPVTYELTVINGNGSGNYDPSSMATITTSLAAEEFLGWKNEEGIFISYEPTYKFSVTRNMIVTAAKKEIGSEIPKAVPFVVLDAMVANEVIDSGHVMRKVFGTFTVPQGAVVLDQGFVSLKNIVPVANLPIDGREGYTKVQVPVTNLAGQAVRIIRTTNDAVFYVQGYIKYSIDGVIDVAYSEIIKAGPQE